MALFGCPTRIYRNPSKSKILPFRRFLLPINTTQWSETFPYCSIILKTFKNTTVKVVFERKCKGCFTGSTWVGGEEE